MNIKLLEPAEFELDDAFEYYEYQQPDLGYRFITEFKYALELIQYYPKGWHEILPNTRRCIIKNFPYGIIYQVREDHIIVLAIANLHRKPNYWISRLES